MKTRLSVLLLAFAAGAAANEPYVRTIDLDSASAIAALRSSNPPHFDRLRQLLERNIGRESGTVEQFVRTAGATDIQTGPLIQTSYPAQAQMSFVLDDTRYRLRVRLGGGQATRIR